MPSNQNEQSGQVRIRPVRPVNFARTEDLQALHAEMHKIVEEMMNRLVIHEQLLVSLVEAQEDVADTLDRMEGVDTEEGPEPEGEPLPEEHS